MAERCSWCHRPLTICRQPVDERFPARAREAYARAGLTHAATCVRGQALDLLGTGGWCWDRARRDPGWSGEALTDAERRGVGPAVGARYS